MRSIVLQVLTVFLLQGGLTGCSSAEKPGSASRIPSQIPSGSFVGQVAETMDAGGYTYVRLTRDGEEIWAAGPQTQVSNGQEIAVTLGMKMEGFRSETLDREFEVVYFVTALNPAGGTSRPTGTPHGSPAAGGGAAQEIDPASIQKPADGVRVAELWKDRGALTGTEVTVRGKVVKFTPNVMGRNWIHLQDGTGDAAEGTHDVTVTSQDQVAIGDEVTLRGTVVSDQDFGSGYRYELLLEKATIQR